MTIWFFVIATSPSQYRSSLPVCGARLLPFPHQAWRVVLTGEAAWNGLSLRRPLAFAWFVGFTVHLIRRFQVHILRHGLLLGRVLIRRWRGAAVSATWRPPIAVAKPGQRPGTALRKHAGRTSPQQTRTPSAFGLR